jgi:cAMP-dependent protein kinase regulator
MLKKKNN